MTDLLKKIMLREEDKAKKEALEIAKKSFCPVCKSCMADVGCLTIRFKQLEDSELNGNYCNICYSKFLAKNIPKFEEICPDAPIAESNKQI